MRPTVFPGQRDGVGFVFLAEAQGVVEKEETDDLA